MNKIKIIKPYQFRHDILICEGAELVVGPHRAAQLINAGFAKDLSNTPNLSETIKEQSKKGRSKINNNEKQE